jgi:hypothetical protein
MKKLIYLIFIFFPLNIFSQNAVNNSLNTHKNYYKPYKAPLAASYAYADLGFVKSSGLKKYNRSSNISNYKGKNFRIGVVRAYSLNNYKFDENYGYLGKKNKLYGQFNFGWFFQSARMANTEMMNMVNMNNGFYRYADFTKNFSFNGFEIGTGLVQNINNWLALESNFQILPFPLVKQNNRNIKEISKGKFIYNINSGIRLKNFGLNFNWTALSFKEQEPNSKTEYKNYRTRYNTFNTTIKYIYNF